MTQLQLWRNNRRDAQWGIDVDELARQFLASTWADPEMRADRALAGFIGDTEHGLSSVWEDRDAFDVALVEIRRQRGAEG
jgi:hypothetical protein